MINEIDEAVVLSCHSLHPLIRSYADLVLLVIQILMHKLFAGPILAFHHFCRKDVDADVGDDSIEEERFADSEGRKH